MTRVTLSARVAQAAVDADRLRETIGQERLVTDELEVDRGVLSTPDRLASIASASMCMVEPGQLGYLEIGGVASEAGEEAPIPVGRMNISSTSRIQDDQGFSVRTLIAAIMDMAAGEAEVLLVGDVGLASSR
jgi:hypothetical protein